MSKEEALTLAEIEKLAGRVFLGNGCDEANADALTRTVVAAERDGSRSHGLFRVPGYVASLQSGKVDGHANPTARRTTPACVIVDGDGGFAPLAIERGIPLLAEAATENGIAVMSIVATHHFAALWHETEALAAHGLAAIACVNYAPVVAPFGGSEAIFGTNPISFAWPRPGKRPAVFDLATAAMAQGEVQIAARDGFDVPEGTGLDRHGQATTDPAEILEGVQLPFGGYKGSAIALMVELLAGGATGELFSYEAEDSITDGGPARGGELVIALSPERLAGPDWAARSEKFFARFEQIEGARLPGSKRHSLRDDENERLVDASLLERVRSLC
jgi:delta1-piperideine-2-carboxylate reductase